MNMLNKKVIAMAMASLLVTPLSLSFAQTGIEINPTSSVSSEVLKRLASDTYVIDQKVADVTGDHREDRIYLIGHKNNKAEIYADHLTLLVEDGENQELITGDLEGLGGYQGKLFTGDFSGNGIADVMVSVPTGGSGGMVDHRILSFKDGQSTVLFNQENNQGIQFAGKFVDGFKAEISNEEYRIHTTIDLQSKKDLYMTANIYDVGGKVLQEVKPISYPLGSLEPVDWDHNGVYELKGIQRIIGAYGADGIGNVYSNWKYENNKWVVQQIEITSFVQTFQGGTAIAKPKAKTLVLTEGDRDKEITVESGDEIQIKLPEISGTGYQWSLDSIDKDSIELVKETTEKMENLDGRVGAPYTKVFTFKTKKMGKVDIQLYNVRSWEGKDKAVNSFRITVNNLPKGL